MCLQSYSATTEGSYTRGCERPSPSRGRPLPQCRPTPPHRRVSGEVSLPPWPSPHRTCRFHTCPTQPRRPPPDPSCSGRAHPPRTFGPAHPRPPLSPTKVAPSPSPCSRYRGTVRCRGGHAHLLTSPPSERGPPGHRTALAPGMASRRPLCPGWLRRHRPGHPIRPLIRLETAPHGGALSRLRHWLDRLAWSGAPARPTSLALCPPTPLPVRREQSRSATGCLLNRSHRRRPEPDRDVVPALTRSPQTLSIRRIQSCRSRSLHRRPRLPTALVVPTATQGARRTRFCGPPRAEGRQVRPRPSSRRPLEGVAGEAGASVAKGAAAPQHALQVRARPNPVRWNPRELSHLYW